MKFGALTPAVQMPLEEKLKRMSDLGMDAWQPSFGELAQAVRKGTPAQVAHEFSDVLAWLATLANQVDVDLTEVVDRYRDGCPKCSAIPCSC